ncbi:hypothetical protein K488DRAFT_86707, partial [Vararia minispora EC-137]
MAYANVNDSVGDANGHGNLGHQQSEELYKRSVMLVIWYKVSALSHNPWSTVSLSLVDPPCLSPPPTSALAHAQPLRFLNPLPSFPYLSLAQFPSLVTSLSLNQNSFIDAWNPFKRQWEQHMINTVRVVVHEQRVLYRLRQSLLEGIEETDCPGLDEELASQLTLDAPPPAQNGLAHPHTPALTRKRPAGDPPNASPPPPHKYYHSDAGHYARTDGQQQHQQALSQQQQQPYALPTQSSTYPGANVSRKSSIQTPRMQTAHVHDAAPTPNLSPEATPVLPPTVTNSPVKPYLFPSQSLYGQGPVTSPPPAPTQPQSSSAPPSSARPHHHHHHHHHTAAPSTTP